MSLSSPHPGDERRQYFRIRHSLLMSYETIDTTKNVSLAKELQPDSTPCIYLLKELNNIEQENQSFINSLQSEQGAISGYITGLNDKLGLLTHYIINHLDVEYRELLQVDLSGGGIRFESESPLDLEQELKMELVLVPEYINIATYGKVVDCHKIHGKQAFELAISFTQILESDRDAIIKHVFEAQSKQLRADKERLKASNKKNEN